MFKLKEILFVGVTSCILFGQTASTDKPFSIFQLLFKSSERLVHHSPAPFFNHRPTELELFVDFPQDSLENVSLFIKTDLMNQYQEQPLTDKKGLYAFSLNPEEFPGIKVTYFYYVKTLYQGSYAYPLNKDGQIKPIEQRFIDPVEYYKWKKILNR